MFRYKPSRRKFNEILNEKTIINPKTNRKYLYGNYLRENDNDKFERLYKNYLEKKGFTYDPEEKKS